MALNLLPQAGQNLVLAGAIISIMLNPVLFTLLEKYLDKTETLDEQTLEEVLGRREAGAGRYLQPRAVGRLRPRRQPAGREADGPGDPAGGG